MSLNRSVVDFESSTVSGEYVSPSGHDRGVAGVLGNVVMNDSVNCSGEEGRNVSLCVTSGPVHKNWVALFILLAIVVTVMGNILVIMAVSLERKLQNATNYFLMSLAITDMLLGLLVMPVAMVTILYNYDWPFPSALCPIWIYLDVLFSTSSIMHLCAISFDRYIGIRHPFQHSRANSRARTRVKITAAWTISAGISMPVPVLGLHDHSKVFRGCSCQLTDDSFVLAGSFVAFFVPLIIMLVTYFLTVSRLRRQATLCLDRLAPRPKWLSVLDFLPHSSFSSERLFTRGSLCPDAVVAAAPVASGSFGRRAAQAIGNEQKASKVLGVVFFLFVAMWCPFFVTNVMAVTCGASLCDPALMDCLLNVFVWVGYLSSAVNPLVYTLFNKTYRTAFAHYLRCHYQEEQKPLQAILVNTIPPLAFTSSKLPQQGQATSLRCSAEGSTLATSPGTKRPRYSCTPGTGGADESVSYM
ncbi:5-hydroxytryptamine receptor 2A [Electrophorus electricus]|uniref:5-hydroxytryptamine receptor 2A n=1 Tax=Electrophorus electricus TaxID=8005 RepID=A0A4W4F2C7_ELEEL|nr:5-hydroxytryptamine receptor 2A [Electrophorus electricus]